MSFATRIFIGTGLLVFGLVVIPAITATVYARGVGSATVFDLVAFSCFAILSAGTFVLVWNVPNIFDSSEEDYHENASTSWRNALRFIMRDRTSLSLRLSSTIVYGIFLSLISGILVIRTGQGFSTLYKVSIPSTALAVCCGPIGQMPQLAIYLSDNVGLVIAPLALVLLLTVSWLVGLNANAAVLAFRIRSHRRDSTFVSTMGSFLGLFSVCPTCAQGLLAALLGTTGAVFVTVLAAYQSIIISLSLPMLVASLGWTARNLSNSLSACGVPWHGQPCLKPSKDEL